MLARRARLLLVLSLFVACGGAGAPAGPAGADAPRQARAVEVAEARLSPHPRVLSLSGTLAALEKVQVAARVEGPITDVKVDLGDRVAREDVLAAIRPIDYRARVTEVDAAQSQAQRDVKRLESLGGVATAEELEQARTRLAEARAQRALAGRQLTDTTVRAPFAGAIAARHVAPGTYVKPGTPLFDLVADDQLKLTLEVPERYAALIKVGTPVQISLKESLASGMSGPEAPVSEDRPAADGAARAEVTRVSPVVSPTTRTFAVEAVFSPEGSALRPGMFIVAELSLGREDRSVRVPRSAVFHVLGRDRVMRVEDGVAVAHDVELIAEDGAEAVVIGLEPGAQVITRGPALVAPGTPVVPEAAVRAEDPKDRPAPASAAKAGPPAAPDPKGSPAPAAAAGRTAP